MKEFSGRNEKLQNGRWIDGWREFCASVKENYQKPLRGLETPDTPKEKTELFAHFLDCEAHTDVWRELYKTWNWTNEK